MANDEQRRRVRDELLVVTTHRAGNAMVVSLRGDLDLCSAPRLVPVVERCLSESWHDLLVVDLREVAFLGAAGLTALLDGRNLAAERALPLRLLADDRNVLRPLQVTGLDRVLHVCSTLEDALHEPARPTM